MRTCAGPAPLVQHLIVSVLLVAVMLPQWRRGRSAPPGESPWAVVGRTMGSRSPNSSSPAIAWQSKARTQVPCFVRWASQEPGKGSSVAAQGGVEGDLQAFPSGHTLLGRLRRRIGQARHGGRRRLRRPPRDHARRSQDRGSRHQNARAMSVSARNGGWGHFACASTDPGQSLRARWQLVANGVKLRLVGRLAFHRHRRRPHAEPRVRREGAGPALVPHRGRTRRQG